MHPASTTTRTRTAVVALLGGTALASTYGAIATNVFYITDSQRFDVDTNKVLHYGGPYIVNTAPNIVRQNIGRFCVYRR